MCCDFNYPIVWSFQYLGTIFNLRWQDYNSVVLYSKFFCKCHSFLFDRIGEDWTQISNYQFPIFFITIFEKFDRLLLLLKLLKSSTWRKLKIDVLLLQRPLEVLKILRWSLWQPEDISRLKETKKPLLELDRFLRWQKSNLTQNWWNSKWRIACNSISCWLWTYSESEEDSSCSDSEWWRCLDF